MLRLLVNAWRPVPEADEIAPGRGEIFRQIAAGVTLLQLKAKGRAPAPETIVLATD